MAISLKQSIEELGVKLKRIERDYSRLQEEKVRLEAENAELRSDIKRLRGELKATETSVEFLTMSHLLADKPDNIIRVRRQIDGMIREIDRCISQLKE